MRTYRDPTGKLWTVGDGVPGSQASEPKRSGFDWGTFAVFMIIAYALDQKRSR